MIDKGASVNFVVSRPGDLGWERQAGNISLVAESSCLLKFRGGKILLGAQIAERPQQ